MYFTRPGGATGDAAVTLVGQCAINPFISTSPSLLSASISPLSHHLSTHSSLAVYLSFSFHLLLPQESLCGFVQSCGWIPDFERQERWKRLIAVTIWNWIYHGLVLESADWNSDNAYFLSLLKAGCSGLPDARIATKHMTRGQGLGQGKYCLYLYWVLIIDVIIFNCMPCKRQI